MGYELDAILARQRDIAKWKLKTALVYPLTDELGLIPLTEDFYNEINPVDQWAVGASKRTKVARLTAEFFGGMGGHDCTLWVDGQSQSGLDINEVLAHFGVEPEGNNDAFDTVGLGRHRRNETWAAHALIDPIQDSVETLIGALQYNCGDKRVQEKVRSIAASRLGELKAVAAINALKQTLQDPEYGTRLSATCALGDIGKPALPILIDALNVEDPWGVVFTLGKMGPAAKPAVPHLVPLLHHKDWRIRIETIRTLSSIGSVGLAVGARLVVALLTDPEKLVRDAAREALKSVRGGS
ncbi:MAG TPA: HEAT repeat domain-containing protein [Candidatus Obscuribacterales bacterium]